MAKRITFDTEIIETLYTSLRQYSSDRLEGAGRMAYLVCKETMVIEQLANGRHIPIDIGNIT